MCTALYLMLVSLQHSASSFPLGMALGIDPERDERFSAGALSHGRAAWNAQHGTSWQGKKACSRPSLLIHSSGHRQSLPVKVGGLGWGPAGSLV